MGKVISVAARIVCNNETFDIRLEGAHVQVRNRTTGVCVDAEFANSDTAWDAFVSQSFHLLTVDVGKDDTPPTSPTSETVQ